MTSPVSRNFPLQGMILIVLLLFSGCISQKQVVQPTISEQTDASTPDTLVTPETVTSDTLETAPSSQLKFLPANLNEDSTMSDTVAYLLLEVDDSTSNDSVSTDSTLLDSSLVTADTLAKPKEEQSDLDTNIVYAADKISFNVLTRSSILKGNATIKYKDMMLQADRIEVDWNNNIMTATPTMDTLWTDTTYTEIDTIRAKGVPAFKQGNEIMYGDLMKVNMKNRQGYIEGGKTEFGDGFYTGHDIQKVTDQILFIQDGKYTTCDNDHPHFCFASDEMMMIYKDKVVGKPVQLMFGDVPIWPKLPFVVFSVKPGRHSGLIIPTYGDNGTQGRFLRNLGYYWAASDYWDMKNTIDYYEKTGFLFRTDIVYNKRYKYRGGVAGSINNQTVNGIRNNRWDLRVRHDQDISEKTKLRVNGTFVSDGSYYKDNSLNANRRLDQKIQSNATLTHRWNSGASMSMNLQQEQNLLTDENKQTLPNMSFNLGSKNLFPSKDKKKSSAKDLIYTPPEARRARGERIEREDDEERWYNSITYRYSNRLQNQRTENRETTGDVETPLVEKYRSGITHSMSINAPQKIFKHFSLNPSITYKEDWFNERKHFSIEDDGSLIDKTERGFFQRRTFTTSLSTNTKFYGYFNINKGSVKVIRHVVTPSVSFSYRPDFSSTDWGYYQNGSRIIEETVEEQDTTYSVFREVAFSKDRYTGSVFGGSGSGKSQTVSFSLGNLFQMKRVKIDDQGEEEEIKTDLFNYNLSTNYNFAKDSLNLGDLRGTLRANPISGKNKIGPLESLSFDFSTTHSFYQYDLETGKTINKYYADLGRGANLIRLTNFTTNARFTLAGKSPFTREQKQEEVEEDTLDYEDADEVLREFDDRFRDPTENMSRNRGGSSPWKISGNFRYTMNMASPLRVTETIRMNGTFSVKLTPKWNFQYTTGVDLHTRDITSSSLSVVRDLHCWEGRFTWNPRGIGQGFYLNIGIKSPQLRDVKLEQKRGTSSPLGYY